MTRCWVGCWMQMLAEQVAFKNKNHPTHAWAPWEGRKLQEGGHKIPHVLVVRGLLQGISPEKPSACSGRAYCFQRLHPQMATQVQVHLLVGG